MARTRSWSLVCLLAIGACGNPAGGGGDGGTYASIRVDPDVVTLTLALGATATQAYTVLGTDGAGEHDITAGCIFNVDPAFGAFAGATLTALAHGGKTVVTATCGSQTATSTLTIDLTGAVVVGPNVPANAAQIFGAATLGTDPNRTPAIEYPLDHAVAPLNIPPMETQWTTAGNDLFHVSLTSTYAHVDVYVAAPQAILALGDWEAIVGTAVGEGLTFTVEGLAQAAPDTKFASTPVAIVLSHDTIDTSAIYWWASSQGSIISQTFGNTSAPTPIIANCTACHSVSRAGSRIGYSRCVNGQCGGEWVGFLHYDRNAAQWNEVVNADNKTIAGAYTTFAPVGNPFPNDSQAIAMVSSMSGTLGLYDPDTGAAVPSNLASVATGGSALMPDWSPDGSTVVFASTPHAGQAVDLTDSSIATMSYSYSSGQHVFGTAHNLVTSPITLGGQSYSNLFFPSFSPDGELVVFNAARSGWRNFTDARTAGQRLALVHANGGTPIDLTALDGGNVDLDITWPHWAPGVTSDYYWLVFSSERDYGHEVTATNTAAPCVANGVKQCKQIWIGAISKQALASGALDPSAPPVWLPGQDTQADNISPYWTLPAGVQ